MKSAAPRQRPRRAEHPWICPTFVRQTQHLRCCSWPLSSRKPPKRRNRNTSHAKTTFLPFQMLKTSRRVPRRRTGHWTLPELWVPGNLPEFPGRLPGRFANSIFSSRNASENRRFFRTPPGRSFLPFWSPKLSQNRRFLARKRPRTRTRRSSAKNVKIAAPPRVRKPDFWSGRFLARPLPVS